MEANFNEKSRRITDTQKSILVAFMEEHIDLHRGRLSASFTNDTAKMQWQEIALLLNDHGAVKSWEKWRQVSSIKIRSNVRELNLHDSTIYLI